MACIQGDILYIFGIDGTKHVTYSYDAWGNQTVIYSNVGTNYQSAPGVQYNPFTYRGYYYDEETGLYYLNSRYYNPEWGRFINSDCYLNANGDILGFNMFAYCGNNPVMYVDSNGEFCILSTILALAVVAIITVALSSCNSVHNLTNDKYYTVNNSVDEEKFDTIEDAVKDFGDKYWRKSMEENKEYATVIFEFEENGNINYSYSVVSIGVPDSVQPYNIYGDKASAIVHTHPSYSRGSIIKDWFSSQDCAYGDYYNIPVYMFNKSKNLAVYNTDKSYKLLQWRE